MSWTEEKPKHINQLFYTDLRKLPINTELALYGSYVNRWLYIKGDKCYAQYLGLELLIHTSEDNFWGMKIRLESGKEDIVYLSGFGAVPTHNPEKWRRWICNSWITLRYPNDETK